MWQDIVTIFFISLMFGMLVMPLFKDFAIRQQWLTLPKPEQDIRRMPYLGGLAIFIIFGIGLFIITTVIKVPIIFSKLNGLIIASAMIMAMGLYDDFRELAVLPKLAVQIIAAFILARFGIRTHIILIGDPWNYFISIIWIAGIVNAFNFLDILDGLCGGIALIAAMAFFIISLLTNNTHIALICAVLMGVLSVFLKYNYPPAKIFLGNSGSMFLGLLLGAIALEISYASEGHAARLVSPLIVLAVPIFDTLFVIFTRVRKKKPIVKKSNDHFIFLLDKINFAREKSLKFIYKLGILAAIAAVLVNLTANIVNIIIFTGLISMFLTIGIKVSRAVDKREYA